MTNQLFNNDHLSNALAQHKAQCMNKIALLDENRVLNTSPKELANYFENEFMLVSPTVNEGSIQTDHEDIQIDVRSNPLHAMHGRGYSSHSPYVPGTRFNFFVPFIGDERLLYFKPSTFNINRPRAVVKCNELVFTYEHTEHNCEDVLDIFQRDLENLKKHLAWIDRDASKFNSSLQDEIIQQIEARHKKLLNDRKLASNLGFPIRRRSDAPDTYIAPEVKRVVPSIPNVLKEQHKPEPTLDDKEYEHILSVILNMVIVMERSPKAFKNMAEEDLRQHFLVQLNGQYEGQATGETFNYEGKTDILIRVEGKNIFIAECKFWNGPASLNKALDQLLSYVSWRDTKTALLLFNRDRDMTTVLKRIPSVIKTHPNFMFENEYNSHTGFKYTFVHQDDSNRKLLLTILVFDVPR